MVLTRSGKRQRIRSPGKKSVNQQQAETEDEVQCGMGKVRRTTTGGCEGGVKVIEERDIVAGVRTSIRTKDGLGSEMNWIEESGIVEDTIKTEDGTNPVEMAITDHMLQGGGIDVTYVVCFNFIYAKCCHIIS